MQEGYAQAVRWDGEAGDSLWNNPLNWEGNTLPGSGNDVWLDHSLLNTSYVVKLPEGTNGITIRSLVIASSETDTILVMVPPLNKAVPALATTTAPGIQLGRGGVLVNASGAASGNAITVSDSLRLLEGGRFVQRSETAHATLIGRLAQSPGTERGVVEFDVPGGASYTVSVSNRIYGTVMFNALAAGGQKSYLSSGSGPLLVRGQCIVGAGATWSLNYSGVCTVERELTIAGTLNLSTGTHSNVLKLKGDFSCAGKVTETGTGTPLFEWCGNAMQSVHMTGLCQNSIGFQLNNPAGVVLQTSLAVTGKLLLTRGVLYSTPDKLLVLDTGCIVQADSLANNVCIQGPVCKKGVGAQAFTYLPVGYGNMQRWVALKELTGNVTIEYVRADPAAISAVKGEGLSHVSSIEYWKVMANEPVRGKLVLSFDGVNSGGVTNLSTLRVASLVAGRWVDKGNTGCTGTAGANGSVTSETMDFSASQVNYFTLASSDPGSNILPDERIDLLIVPRKNNVWMEAFASGEGKFTQWTIERCRIGHQPEGIYTRQDSSGVHQVSFSYTPPANEPVLYRACTQLASGRALCSKWIRFQFVASASRKVECFPNPAGKQVIVKLEAATQGVLILRVIGLDGKTYQNTRSVVIAGMNTLKMDLSTVLPGMYWVYGEVEGAVLKPTALIKY